VKAFKGIGKRRGFAETRGKASPIPRTEGFTPLRRNTELMVVGNESAILHDSHAFDTNDPHLRVILQDFEK
jgi:hypothetical protein